MGDMKNKYKIDEKVGVYGKRGRVYVIQGVQETLDIFGTKIRLVIQYELRDIETGEVIHKNQSEVYRFKNHKKTREQEEAHSKIIDAALDEYNDKMALFQIFDDNKYKEEAEFVIKSLKEYVAEYHSR